MSTRKSRASCARDVALFRYSLIRPLADPVLTAAERGVLVREMARGVHVGPAGEAVRVSRSTLDRWVRAWRVGGFDALVPPVRQVHPRTVAEALDLGRRRDGTAPGVFGRFEADAPNVRWVTDVLCRMRHNPSYGDRRVMPTGRRESDVSTGGRGLVSLVWVA